IQGEIVEEALTKQPLRARVRHHALERDEDDSRRDDRRDRELFDARHPTETRLRAYARLARAVGRPAVRHSPEPPPRLELAFAHPLRSVAERALDVADIGDQPFETAHFD